MNMRFGRSVIYYTSGNMSFDGQETFFDEKGSFDQRILLHEEFGNCLNS
ncbi:MAG TPA: hypothetical protein VHS31_01870 [Tepidisphaeraceae bacterium]|nr:hypothetical protein [Tepidisphaeraceae bacterium]